MKKNLTLILKFLKERETNLHLSFPSYSSEKTSNLKAVAMESAWTRIVFCYQWCLNYIYAGIVRKISRHVYGFVNVLLVIKKIEKKNKTNQQPCALLKQEF